ncbi:MAG: hypothetical protein ABJF23_11735 [Bryobacteraceae bacterium]
MNSESAVQQLETYVLRPDDFHGDAIPRRLERQEVARFVVERVGKDAGFKSLVRLERLVNFYDLQEVCGHLSSLLPTAPTPGDVMKAAVIARTVAATCGPADVQRMASYAPGLIANAQNTADIAELLELQDRLGPGVDSRALEARIGQLRAAYAASSGSNYQARLETSRLDEMRNLRLDRVRRGNETKAQVLAIADRPKRISEEIKIYLTLDYGYLEYLLPWSAARLRRETWGQSPADQTVRKEDPARRSEVAKMFHTVGANLERLPDVDPENRPSLQVRCLRAVSYFGSALSGPEWTFISDHAGRQVDVLSND